MIRPGIWTSGPVGKFVIRKKSAFAFCVFSSVTRRLSQSGREGLVLWSPVKYGLRSTSVDWSMTCMSPTHGGGGIAGTKLVPLSTLTSSSRTMW